MADFPGLVGGSNQVRSLHVNAERTVNWYIEQAPGLPRAQTWLVPTPGLAPFVVLGGGPVRAVFAQAGRAFAVGGAGFYEVFAAGTATYRGAVAFDGLPATISSNNANGNQLFVTSGGETYIYSLTTDSLTGLGLTGPPGPTAMACFSDGYFIALKRQSNQFNISALYDGLSWDPLDVFQISTSADPVVALVESHRDLWLFGEQTTSVWNNTGDADIPYQPQPSVKINQGAAAAFAAVGIDNTVMWLGQSAMGDRVVWRAQGYTPQRVSSHAVEYALRQARRIDDAIAYAYEDEGHTFYVLYVPDLANVRTWGTSWVYDVAADRWHERALWDSTRMDWQPHRSRCHAFGFGRHLVGDRLSPAIYEMRLGLGTEQDVALVDAPIKVQQASSGFIDSVSKVLAFASDVVAGNQVLAIIASYPYEAAAGVVSDTQANTYDLLVDRGVVTEAGVRIYRVTSAIGGALTFTWVPATPATMYASMALVELSGAGDVNQVGSRLMPIGATQSTAGLPPTTENGCLVIGALGNNGGDQGITEGSGWTEWVAIDLPNAVTTTLSVIARTANAAGLMDPTWTHTALPDNTMACAVALAPEGDA